MKWLDFTVVPKLGKGSGSEILKRMTAAMAIAIAKLPTNQTIFILIIISKARGLDCDNPLKSNGPVEKIKKMRCTATH